MWLLAKNGAIREKLAPMKADKIKRIISDFKLPRV